ncbi:TM0106 family RecB-like putative nuclease [Aestuariimicrobium soli]|uniref:TM0106 family RecB-like putative nuclease n=1 Tax=Aestuariimicrobium soli TaxID=2035834 RepID=UPI003EC0B688
MIMLGAYAAESCPVKTQHEYDPLAPPAPTDEAAQQERFAGANLFKDEVYPVLASAPGAVDLRDCPDALVLTRQAVADGAPLILGPRLPWSISGHRKGHPEALVRGADRADGSPGYLPLRIKRHRVLERQRMTDPWVWVAPLARPWLDDAQVPDEASFRGGRERDALQLAHFWRLLDEIGWVAEGCPTGALIGTDQIADLDGDLGVVWVNLLHKGFRAFSRTASSGWKRRSALERYDHEFGFRVKVAQTAQAHTAESARLMVQPIVTRECNSCQWWSVCAPALDDDDLSMQINKSPLDVREIGALRKLGVSTVNDLVSADIEALLPAYLPEVQHRPGGEQRLRLAARRATLIAEGVNLERLNEIPADLPEHDLEIDFDIETSRDDRIYLWGFLVHDRASSKVWYESFADFRELDDEQECELAARAAAWLVRLCENRDAQVYHYSDYELVHLAKVGAMSKDAHLLTLLERRDLFTDLFASVRDHWFGAQGLGLKVVAFEGPGFRWRDPDPSGLASQGWFTEAVAGDTEQTRSVAVTRLLEYNEDDVRATWAVRDWLRRT